jgi:hypothetical protein
MAVYWTRPTEMQAWTDDMRIVEIRPVSEIRCDDALTSDGCVDDYDDDGDDLQTSALMIAMLVPVRRTPDVA